VGGEWQSRGRPKHGSLKKKKGTGKDLRRRTKKSFKSKKKENRGEGHLFGEIARKDFGELVEGARPKSRPHVAEKRGGKNDRVVYKIGKYSQQLRVFPRGRVLPAVRKSGATGSTINPAKKGKDMGEKVSRTESNCRA